MNIIRNIISVCGLITASLHADKIKVYNCIDEDLIIATYYKESDATRVSKPMSLAANSSVTIERGKRSFHIKHPLHYFTDRELVFTTDADELKENLSAKDFNRMFHTNVGSKQGSHFYVTRDNELLVGYNKATWHIKKSIGDPIGDMYGNIKNKCTMPVKKRIQKDSPAIVNNSYKDTVAQVRMGNQLPKGESDYRKKRKPKVKNALEKFLGHPISNSAVPTIALLESGGGYRAMTCSLGMHMGLEKIGLMDGVTYMVGVSGSTWSIGLWIGHQTAIDAFKKHLTQKMSHGLSEISKDEIKLMASEFSKKYALEQEITLVDTFGAYLANILLSDHGDQRHMIRLSDQIKLLEDASFPCPIYTAVCADHKSKQDWYEFTPWEFGASWLGIYVPSWAYGRKFNNGKSIDFAPEQSFGYIMGTCGSAFAASLERMYKEVEKSMPKENVFSKCVNATLAAFGHHRFTAAHVNNFTYGMADCPLRNYNILKLGDAGVECNLPFAAVSEERPERKADILVFMDANDELDHQDLERVEKYARDKKLKFPKIDYNEIGKRVVSIFKDEHDPLVPLVIYLPRYNDKALLKKMKNNPQYADLIPLLESFDIEHEIQEGYASTANFCYKENEVNQLSGLMEFNVFAARDQIRDAIEWKVKQLEG